jgi:hypothetical protein
MACNGFNHPKDCKCNFRGGHRNSRPPTWRGWRQRAVRRYFSGPNAFCPECRAHIFFVPGPKGGGAFFDQFGPPWPKHACTNRSKPYSPYGRSGKPKLRNRRSEFEQNGWTPFFVRNVEFLGVGTIIHGVALDDPMVFHFGIRSLALSLDRNRPIYFRTRKNALGIVELNYFPLEAPTACTTLCIDDCRNEFDFLLNNSART